MIRSASTRFVLPLVAASLAATPALARPGGWGPGWDAPGWGPSPYAGDWSRSRDPGPVEGKVEVTRFTAEDVTPGTLGQGAVNVGASPTGAGVEEFELKTYEAAVVDSLARAGYQTATTAGAAGQTVELRISHDVVVPEEGPKKPVSGEMTMGVSNRGSMMGMAVAVDLSKPKKALVSTRLDARIVDKASGKVLWEGRADIVTREGSDKWTDGAIAARLSKALFEGFPGKSGETRVSSR